MVESLIVPAIELSERHDFGDIVSLSGSLSGNLRDVHSLDSKFEVKRLGEKRVSDILVESLQEGEDHWDQILRNQVGEVEFWGVDPGVQEVVVAVWEALSLPEELTSCCFVELGSLFIREWHVDHVEITVLSISNPFGEFVSLDAVDWPVPSVLGFDDIETIVKSEGHDTVPGMGSGSIHDHWIKTIKSHDSEIVTRLNLILINFYLLD